MIKIGLDEFDLNVLSFMGEIYFPFNAYNFLKKMILEI